MPCKKCKDGKYKYGNTGECKYDTKEECDKANPNKYNKMKEYPTPLGKKTYDEYAKELKEFNLSKVEKVELGKIQDVTKLYNVIKKAKDNMDDDLAKAKRSAIIGDTEIQNFNKLASDVEKAAKELGVPTGDLNLQKLLNDIKSFQKEFNSVIDI